MNIPIFPNRSYILAVTKNVGVQNSIVKVCAELRAQVLFCSGLSDIQKKLKILTRVTGIFVVPGHVASAELEQINQLAQKEKIPVNTSVTPAVESFVKSLIPKGLEATLVDACNTIMPGFFEGIGTFTPLASPSSKPGHHNRQVIWSVVADSLLGFCSVKAKTDELKSKLDPASVLLEATNQSIGLIVQALVKKGFHARIGLPVAFDLKKIPEVQPLVFFPTANVTDPKNTLEVNLGFVDFEGNPLFELDPKSIADDSGDIELL